MDLSPDRRGSKFAPQHFPASEAFDVNSERQLKGLKNVKVNEDNFWYNVLFKLGPRTCRPRFHSDTSTKHAAPAQGSRRNTILQKAFSMDTCVITCTFLG